MLRVWVAACAAVTFACLAAIVPAHAQSESSSWRMQGETKGTTKSGEAKILKGQSPTPKLPSKLSNAAAAVPAGTIDNSAYEAFEQGKYLTALKLADEDAKKGVPQSHTLAARIHGEGLGVPVNLPLAAQWYKRGAELGDSEAMFGLAVMLAEGRGIPKDRIAAADMFDRAAQTGHVLANYNLALLFLKGDGKPENPYRAAAHLRYAADNGLPQAQYDLGTLFATGTGVDADAFTAAIWIGKAAAAGLTDAEVDYAVLLFRGQGVPVDRERGIEYLRKAATAGVAVAQNRLARCYLQGFGLPQNLDEAAKWNAIAKAGGLTDDLLDLEIAKLPKTQRAAAEKAAVEWRERAQVRSD